ncbi:putative glucan 1,3-beta-glucosidase [Helianthus anomalus]
MMMPFLHRDKVAACAKHYLGDGGTHLGTYEGNTIVEAKELFSIHMPAYYDVVIKGVATIMTSYSSWNGVKMHVNRFIITDFLKNRLKFKGFVISYWQGIDKITTHEHANYTYSIIAGMNAGIDMVYLFFIVLDSMQITRTKVSCHVCSQFMVPYNYTEFIDGLTYLVKNRFIPMSRVDDAVKRILRVKFTMGLFEKPLADLPWKPGTQRSGKGSCEENACIIEKQ